MAQALGKAKSTTISGPAHPECFVLLHSRSSVYTPTPGALWAEIPPLRLPGDLRSPTCALGAGPLVAGFRRE